MVEFKLDDKGEEKKGLEMKEEDYLHQHCLHGLRVRCVGLFCNGSNDLVNY